MLRFHLISNMNFPILYQDDADLVNVFLAIWSATSRLQMSLLPHLQRKKKIMNFKTDTSERIKGGCSQTQPAIEISEYRMFRYLELKMTNHVAYSWDISDMCEVCMKIKETKIIHKN